MNEPPSIGDDNITGDGAIDERRLRQLFSAEVAVCIASPAMYSTLPWPLEAAAIRGASIGRQREFAAGRACARESIARLGYAPCDIPMGTDRSPEWPPGIVGSITHCRGFCAAAVARKDAVLSIGLDAETSGSIDNTIAASVCSRLERDEFLGLDKQTDWLQLTFSAKEAFYKSYYPLAQTFLDFLDVRVRFQTSRARVSGDFSIEMVSATAPMKHLAERTVGRWLIINERVYAAATLVPPERAQVEA